MNSYLTELDMILNDVQKTEMNKIQIFDEFNQEIPCSILETRKKRFIENEKAKKSNVGLKRPAMIQKRKTGVD